MARNEKNIPVVPLAGGLRDSLGGRMVGAGEASAMSGIHHNRVALEARRGSEKVTRRGPRTTCLRLGQETFRNGDGGYVLIPASNRYYDMIDDDVDASIEFMFELDEVPDGTSEHRTLLCCGSPYTTDRLGWEVSLTKGITDGAALMYFSWGSGGNRYSKSFAVREVFPRSRHQYRLVIRPDAATQDEVDFYIDNVLIETMQLVVASISRPLDSVNAPIYIGGVGGYPSAFGAGTTYALKGKIQDLRIWNKALDSTDADVLKFTSEVLDPVGHSDEDFLQGWWPLDDGYGRVVRDKSRWGNDGYMGPSAMVVREGIKAADGAVFLDGHTSFLQADLRYKDLIDKEFAPHNQGASGHRYGLSVRCAVLDGSARGSGAAAFFAEMSGSDNNREAPIRFGVNNSGFAIARWWSGSQQTLADAAVLVPGQMKMWDFFCDGPGTSQEFYLDGEEIATSSLSAVSAQLVNRVRIGSQADFATDAQTPWSRFDTTEAAVPLLVEEVRVFIDYLDADGVAARWEKVLTTDQILEGMGVETAAFVEGSSTVTANGSPDTGFADAFLVSEEEVSVLQEDVETFETQRKIHHISAIAGSAITLSTPFRGRSASNKRVRASRMAGYWKIPGPSDSQLLPGVSDLRAWEEIETKPSPDARGDLVESGGSQVGLLRLLDDLSPAGFGLDFGVVPYERNSAPSRALPRWASGILGSDVPARLVTEFDPARFQTRRMLFHHSTMYDIDDRWRPESPYAGDTGNSLAFVQQGDAVEVPHSNDLDWGADSSTDFWRWRGWVRFDELNGKTVLVAKNKDTDADEINYLAYVESGRFKMRTVTGGNGAEYASDDAPIEKARYHYLDLVKKNNAFELYIDGVQQSTTLTAIGTGFAGFGDGGTPHRIGDVGEALRGQYNSFKGIMTDVEVQNGSSLPGDFPTGDYTPPSSRVAAAGSTVYLFDMADGEDVKVTNLADPGTSDGEVVSDPYVPLMEGMGQAPSDVVPAAHSYNDRFYACSGAGAPQVFDEHGARRMGLVGPSYAPDGSKGSRRIWEPDNINYKVSSLNPADEDRENFGMQFHGNSRIIIPYVAGMKLEGRGDTTLNNASQSMHDYWIKPYRLDKKQVLAGRNFGANSGNYAIVLIPNDAGDAMKVRFTWWDVDKSQFDYIESTNYFIDDITSWWYIWIWFEHGRTTNSHMRIRWGECTSAGETGGSLTDETLVVSGLSQNAAPDTTQADMMLGWSPIVLADEGYEGFHGEIHEARMVSNVTKGATRFSGLTGKTATPDHIFQDDCTDAAYETAGAAVGGTNTSVINSSVFVLNLNDQTGLSLEDTSASPISNVRYELIDGLGADVGMHRVRVTFFDPTTGIESNPGPDLLVNVLTPSDADLPSDAWLDLTGLPISGDTRPLIHRRIYKTAAGGSDYLLALTVEDNSTTGLALRVTDADLLTGQELSNDNAAPPQFSVLGGDDSRLFVGRNDGPGFLYSMPFLPESMPATNLEILDSPSGSRLVAIDRLFGQVVSFLKDAVFVSQAVGTSGFQTSVVATDGGALSGGSIISAARSLLRPSAQGIYAFAGVSDFYRSAPIGRPEGFWADVDLDFPPTGVYWRERDQAMWLLKRKSDARAMTLLALDLTVGTGPDVPANVFTLTDGLDIACLGVVRGRDGVDQLWAGDHLGFVHRLDVGSLDGPRDGFGDLKGSLGSGSTSETLVLAAGADLDVRGDGHRGERVRVRGVDGRTGEARIRSNVAGQIELLDDLGFAPAEDSVYSIGEFECFWRSGFLPYGEQHTAHQWGYLHLNADPTLQAQVEVIARVDLHESGVMETNLGLHSLAHGHLRLNLGARKVPRGHLLQIELRSWEHFVIYDYSVGVTPAATESGSKSGTGGLY